VLLAPAPPLERLGDSETAGRCFHRVPGHALNLCRLLQFVQGTASDKILPQELLGSGCDGILHKNLAGENRFLTAKADSE
jgi:hypothetical protein